MLLFSLPLLAVTVKPVAYCIQHIFPKQPFAIKNEYDLIYLQVCVCSQYCFFFSPSLVMASQALVLEPGCCREV